MSSQVRSVGAAKSQERVSILDAPAHLKGKKAVQIRGYQNREKHEYRKPLMLLQRHNTMQSELFSRSSLYPTLPPSLQTPRSSPNLTYTPSALHSQAAARSEASRLANPGYHLVAASVSGSALRSSAAQRPGGI